MGVNKSSFNCLYHIFSLRDAAIFSFIKHDGNSIS